MTTDTMQLTAREAREYNLAAALLALADDRPEFRTGLAFDIDQDLRKQTTEHHGERNLFVPLAMRAGLDSITATKGVEAVFKQPFSWLDMLRIQSVVQRAGALFIPGLKGTVPFPRLTAQATPSARLENPGSDVAESNLLAGQMNMTPHGIQATTSYSRQLLAQSKVVQDNSIDLIVGKDMAEAHAVIIDQYAVGGSGAAGQPTGVAVQLAGNQLVPFGANGAQPLWANMVDIEAAVANANSDYPDSDDSDEWPKPLCAWVTHPTIRTRLRKTDRGTPPANSGWYIMADEQRCKLMGYPFYVSNSVRSAQTVGTSVDACDILFGRWSDLYVGIWGPGLELVVDPFRLKKQGMVEVASWEGIDIGIARTGSFSGTIGARP